MSFIREVTVKGHTYCQLAETYRENGKVKQRVLRHLGKRYLGKRYLGKRRRPNKLVLKVEAALADARELKLMERDGFHLEYVRTPDDSSNWTPDMVVDALNAGKAEVVTGKSTKGGYYWSIPLKFEGKSKVKV